MLRSQGHDVRVLVRNPDKAQNVYQALGEDVPELCQGDITVKASVEAAVRDCEAVVHAAAGTPMKDASAEQLFAINVGGTRNVVDAALEQGVERIVCISSITAIFDPDGSKVTPQAPPKASRLPYGQSKMEAELYLRQRQLEGAPIAILYPGGVLGPDDPGFSDSCKAIKYRIDNGFRIFGDGGMQFVDVRDLASFACSLVEHGGSGRFLIPGVYSSWVEQADMIEAVAGCQLERIPAKGWKLRLVGRVMDFARRFRTIDSPISHETMCYATQWPRISNTDELEKRGLSLRSARESFDDTLYWMVKAGHLQEAQCPNYRSEHD
jgi:nucleoside-diphosphate-sugar epimerase